MSMNRERENETEWNIGWTVGNYCNAKCGHCYSWQLRRSSAEFLLPSDVETVVQQLVQLGTRTVNLGGNEPIFTNGPRLDETQLPLIIRALHDAGIPVGLTTNGFTFHVLDRKYPAELALVNDIDFSLDSPHRDEHDLNRDAPLFDSVIAGIRRAREIGLDCSVITCGMLDNFDLDVLSDFLGLCRALDCEFRINTLKPTEPSLVEKMPTVDQFYEGFSFLMDRTSCVTLGESCISALVGTGSAGCPCGTSSFRINAKDAKGRISLNPCVYLHDFQCGDLLREDLRDIVRSEPFRTIRERRSNIPSACHSTNCEYLESCRGGCAARTYLVTGTLDARDPYCPHDYQSHGGSAEFPHEPPVGPASGIRVHDNYLCTWIGEPLPSVVPVPPADISADARTGMPLSGHHQDASGDTGLVPVAVGTPTRRGP